MYTVLLVDDEPVVLNTERRIIERKIPGFEVIGEAFSVKRALEIYDRQKPDVVLTDIKMPVQSGLVLIQNIMELYLWSHGLSFKARGTGEDDGAVRAHPPGA